MPEPRAHVSVGREGGSDSPTHPLTPCGGAATCFRGCEAFLLEPRCWDSGTQSSSLDARSTLMADDVRY